jgi:hypothetical protein
MVRIVKDAILQEIVGAVPLEKCTFDDIILPRHPVPAFPASKMASLSEKYFSIPAEYLKYYPPTEGSLRNEVGAAERANLRALEATGVLKRKRAGRSPLPPSQKVNNTLSFHYYNHYHSYHSYHSYHY